MDQAVVESPLAALGLDGRYRLSQHEARSGGLRGIRVDVQGLEDQPPHRHWSEIRDQIHAAALAPALKQTVLDVFTRLAEAEATVHGTSAEAVHFHEVGAIDALVDVVGVCAAMQNLNPAEVVCSPLPAGSGTVSTAHGVPSGSSAGPGVKSSSNCGSSARRSTSRLVLSWRRPRVWGDERALD